MPKSDISCFCFKAKPTSMACKKIQQLSTKKKKKTITWKKKQHGKENGNKEVTLQLYKSMSLWQEQKEKERDIVAGMSLVAIALL